MRLFLLFSERKKLVESTKFLLIFLQAHVERLEKLPTCPWSRTRASTQTLYKNQILKMFYVFAINISKIMLEIYYSKEIVTELFVFEATFFSWNIQESSEKVVTLAISGTGVMSDRASQSVCAFKFLALLCGSFCERFISLEAIYSNLNVILTWLHWLERFRRLVWQFVRNSLFQFSGHFSLVAVIYIMFNRPCKNIFRNTDI